VLQKSPQWHPHIPSRPHSGVRGSERGIDCIAEARLQWAVEHGAQTPSNLNNHCANLLLWLPGLGFRVSGLGFSYFVGPPACCTRVSDHHVLEAQVEIESEV